MLPAPRSATYVSDGMCHVFSFGRPFNKLVKAGRPTDDELSNQDEDDLRGQRRKRRRKSGGRRWRVNGWLLQSHP